MEAQAEIRGLLSENDLGALADGAEAGGNPVIGLVEMLRTRLSSEPARWLHRGLTSQDVLDTALMICLRDVVDRLDDELREQVEGLRGLARRAPATPMVARTLTQHAVPMTFGLKVANWLTGVLDAAEALAGVGRGCRCRSVARPARWRRPPSWPASPTTGTGAVMATVESVAMRSAWLLRRRGTRCEGRDPAGDALVGCTDAWGRIAADVLTLSRPEIGELAEGTGGGSSTMPHKHNPVLSVLVRRAP